MRIRENIGRLAVWKAAVILFLLISIFLMGIEELFVSRIFNLIDRSINHFERIFNEESNEIDQDFKQFNEQQAKEDVS